MAKKTSLESLEAKLEKAEQKVIRTGEQYNAACAEFKELLAKKESLQHEKLIELYIKSDKTYEETVAFFGVTEDEASTEKKSRRGRKPTKKA